MKTLTRRFLTGAVPGLVAMAGLAGRAAAQPHGHGNGRENAPGQIKKAEREEAARREVVRRDEARPDEARPDEAARRAAAARVATAHVAAPRVVAPRPVAPRTVVARTVAPRAVAIAPPPVRPQPPRRVATQVPAGQAAPAGMCRIWINGVPAGRQPAPTDCATAERTRPANARVIHGASAGGEVERARLYPRSTGTVSMPTGWPAFNDARLFQSGRRPGTVQAWAPGAARVAWGDYQRNVPTVARFYDASGRLLAIWYDRNLDGTVDAAKLYRAGRLVGSYQR